LPANRHDSSPNVDERSTDVAGGTAPRAWPKPHEIAVAALGLRRPGYAAAGPGAMIAANMSFYVLLGRRGGLRLALAGVPLHHLTTAAAAPAGVALYARGSRR